MKKGIVTTLLLIAFSTAFAQPEAAFNRANKLYQNGQYEAAIAAYDSLLTDGYAHAETEYNLGNAHYRSGHLGQAILHYEKALKLNPNNEDAQHNLKVANAKVVDEFNTLPTPALQRIFVDASSILASGKWALLGVLCIALALGFAAYFLFVKKHSVWLVLFVVSLACSGVLEGIAFGKYKLEQQEFAIITAANSYIKSAPSANAKDLFILHEGTKIKVLTHFNEWQKIKLPDGEIGWMEAGSASTI